MKARARWISRAAGILAFASFWPASAMAQPVPLVRAHAHNDYQNDRPLFDALDRGFGSIEADIHLIEGRLLVAHDHDETTPDRTLESLYLDPLRQLIRQNGGRVYVDSPPLLLLVDIKTDAATTYAVLDDLLRRYADILTIFSGDTMDEGAVTAIVSGNRPRAAMAAQAIRYAAYDGRLDDLDDDSPATFIPLVSDNWAKFSQSSGPGEAIEEVRERLDKVVSKAHAQGRRIRFWATPDDPTLWRVLYDAGVDLLGTDDLAGLQRFLSAADR